MRLLTTIFLLLCLDLQSKAAYIFYASENGNIQQFESESGANRVLLVSDPTRRWNAAAWNPSNGILYASDMNTGTINAFPTFVAGGVGYLGTPTSIFNYSSALSLALTDARAGEFYGGSYFFTGFGATQGNLYQLQLDPTGLLVSNFGQIATLTQSNGAAVGTTMVSGDFVINNGELYFVSNGANRSFFRYDISGRIGAFNNTNALNALAQTVLPDSGLNALARGPLGYYAYSSSTDTYYNFDPSTGTRGSAITTGSGLGAGDATLFTDTPFEPIPEPASLIATASGLWICWRRYRAKTTPDLVQLDR